MSGVLSSTCHDKGMSGWPGSAVNLLMLSNADITWHQRGCSKCVECGEKVLAWVERVEME